MTAKQRLSWLFFKWATKISPGKEMAKIVSEAVTSPRDGLLHIQVLDLFVDSEYNIYVTEKGKAKQLVILQKKSKGDKRSLALILWGKLLRRDG